MTIKQHGGIFGRNPTLNTVTATQFVGPISGLATSAAALKSSATTGLMQITGPAAGATRIMTIPDANFTAARTDAGQTFTGDQTLTDGNLIVSNGKGIDFSATAGTGTSELFDDYEEGAWTPTVTSGAGTVTLDDATGSFYTKIGRTVQVYARLGISTDAAVGTSDLTIGGLPYAVNQIGSGNLTSTNYSLGDYGTGGAHGLVYVSSSSLYHVARTVVISSRATFIWTYYAVYTAS